MIATTVYLLSTLLTGNLIFLLFYNQIKNKANIYDYPDKIRKIHKNKIFLGGGILILFNLILLIIFIFFNNFFDDNFFYSLRNYVTFFIIPFFLFFLGYFDDKWNLSANWRLILTTLIIYIAISIDTDLVIQELRFSNFEKIFYLTDFKIPFTILCFLLFINAFNMFDGINLQASFFSFFIFNILLASNIMELISLFFLVVISLFIILNYFNKMFLGESGSILLSYYISYLLIKSYNIEKAFFADQILLYLLFPGLDLIRLFCFRIWNGKHPFKADTNHLHHMLLNKCTSFMAFLIIALAYIIPISISIYNNNFYLGLILIIGTYFTLIFIYGNNFAKNKNRK
jgi:UDP-GlcNAc:undecaprenyl-phosphate/decaprenyl-phosphate GlcNAc-1-phosphate transferase